LKEAGFVRERYDEGLPDRRFMGLTGEGREIARYAEEILKLV